MAGATTTDSGDPLPALHAGRESAREDVEGAQGGDERPPLAPDEAESIQKLYTKMLERNLSARTVRYTHAVINSAFKQAVKWGMLAQNPAALVDLPKQQRKEMAALSPDEARRFLDAAMNDCYGVLFLFALITGTRPGEYLGLQWKDVDLSQGVVTIQRTLVWRRKGGGYYFSQPKTSKSCRSIPIDTHLVNFLTEHRRKQLE